MVATEASIVVLTERNASTTVGEELARSGFRLLGRVDTSRALLDALQAHQVDVVVAEVSRAERLRELAAGVAPGLQAKLVVVSGLPTEAALFTLLTAGARAFLRRPLLPGLLEQAVNAVVAGHAFVDPRSTTWLVELALHGNRRRSYDGLTLRQAQVVELVRGDLTNREIARVLGVSVPTVKSHLHEAMRRLGVRDRWAATVLAERLRGDRP